MIKVKSQNSKVKITIQKAKVEFRICNPELRRVQGYKPYVVYGLEFLFENWIIEN